MKSYRIWLSAAAIIFLVKMFGTAWIQAEDLGGFDVSVSEGENWSLPDNWQESTSGWEKETDAGSTAEPENESFAQSNKIENSVGESEDIFSSTAESIQQNNQQQKNLQQENLQQENPQQKNPQQENPQQSDQQNSNDQDSNNQGNNNQGSNNQSNNDQGNNNRDSNNQNSINQRSDHQENDGQDSAQPAHKQQLSIQRLPEEKSEERKIPESKASKESKETEKIVEEGAEPKAYISQEERQKAKEQDRAVNFQRTKDMTFFHKKQAGKKDILYLTVTRLNIHQILSVRLNGKECRWNREGSRIVLEDRPDQGKNKVEVRFFLEDGQVRSMEPWIFKCD